MPPDQKCCSSRWLSDLSACWKKLTTLQMITGYRDLRSSLSAGYARANASGPDRKPLCRSFGRRGRVPHNRPAAFVLLLHLAPLRTAWPSKWLCGGRLLTGSSYSVSFYTHHTRLATAGRAFSVSRSCSGFYRRTRPWLPTAAAIAMRLWGPYRGPLAEITMEVQEKSRFRCRCYLRHRRPGAAGLTYLFACQEGPDRVPCRLPPPADCRCVTLGGHAVQPLQLFRCGLPCR